ncbi:Membrane carboxypeptidase (penicillin-binding protein) [Halopseudomonas xinjiangensis]|uniref:peptidoglycan glycosyltransferase n=1 Tax=Halopseudomonas xinjiangensis TaxID=487184 RepID=A0A1H1LUX7_9GAMM|nr:transglycosylase domain-containing protein [Halopseudomonas xinjiangensis]SDR78336.1 Membrane carboxypeptidase (penicillin-binding protein) [Halopseudomonas xinjiangensis]
MRLRTWLLLGVAVLAGVYLIRYESHHSYYQSLFLSRYAKDLTFRVGDGPSDAVRFPQSGPFDVRLGYTAIPLLTPRLRQHGFELTSQARLSPAMLQYVDYGLYPPYQEKTQAGLQVLDCKGDSIYAFQYPQRAYSDFDAVPDLLQRSLLFIENRRLLAPGRDRANPAVDWPRLASASLALLSRRFDDDGSTHGASTLATQIEKYRHSPEGRTFEPKDKLVQMASASVRAYGQGPYTIEARQRLVLDYLNTVPLAAAPGFGEVNGVGDAVWVWFGREFDRFNQDLQGDAGIEAQGQALRQGLAIFVAQRRPSYYLLAGRDDLAELVDSHLRLLARDGIIEKELRDAALAASFGFRERGQASRIRPVIEADKAVTVSRVRLAGLLEQSLYAVDRMDLRAGSSLHADLQKAVSQYIENLADPAFAEQAGLFGERLLSPEKVAAVRYSFTLMQYDGDGNQVRVQTDNTGLPFDLNEGSKLELGSTAKLRVLATYLQIIAELHASLAGADEAVLQQALAEPEDRLSIWVATTLRSQPDMPLPELLEAALERRYSASPAERFYTGGGVQRFRNFRREDDGRNPTMRESLRESINLPFVRLQRDIVRYSIHQAHRDSAALLQDDQDPRRDEYLAQFADREGRTFMLRFWRKYQNKTQAERLSSFLEGLRPTSTRLAAVHRYLYPDASQEDFAGFVRSRTEEVISDKRIEDLYEAYGPGKYSLPDQGYIARVHPLELWLLGYLIRNEGAIFSDAVQASQAERQEVYGWLFRTRHRSARDNRIRTMLEVEAYLDIHARWQAMGYPFDHLVPSLGTALGSSGDRPAALAELMGIIQNGGIRYPTARITELHFGEGTPYETHFQRAPAQGRQVLVPEVAAALREALSQVVEDGTARRLQGTFRAADGSELSIGGKTGTGDNRIHTVASSGMSTGSQVLNRTATFVFFIGDDHFGTLTAFVPGQAAGNFRFTSALPVQVLKGMAPMLTAYFENSQAACSAPAVEMAALD